MRAEIIRTHLCRSGFPPLGEERWQSGRMRVFAKDVSGQKLDRGFESRPLRLVEIAVSLPK